jgi:D-arabinose 1-dehydrogenase-like Zn-dependent alcohol dehydrogenase
VTVLSQSLKKMEDGKRLGADHYYATGDPDTFDALRNSFDLHHQHGVGHPWTSTSSWACWPWTARWSR